MIEINLLPKNYRRGSSAFSLGKVGKYALAGVVGVVLILICVTFYQVHRLSELQDNIERANQRASMLRADIQVVDALIEVKGKIQRRMSAVEKLDRHRSAWVRVLQDVSRNVPEFVWLVGFHETPLEIPKPTKSSGGEEVDVEPATFEVPSSRPVELDGYSFTLNALAAFMIRMMRSDYFDAVELVSSRDTTFEEDGDRAYNFQLTANVHYLSDEELRNLVAQSNQPDDSKRSHKNLN